MTGKYPEFDGSQICAQTEPDLWFPTSDRQTGRLAKTLCGSCLWSKPCLDYALFTDVVGIWGGKTERERSQIRKRLKIKVEALISDTWFQTPDTGKVVASEYNNGVEEGIL